MGKTIDLLTRPCDACGHQIGGGYQRCPKCNIYLVFFCGCGDEVLHNWLNHFGMRFHQLHASGHLNKTGLKSVIKRISAEKIFPVHTENPSAFKEFCKNTEITEREKEYAI